MTKIVQKQRSLFTSRFHLIFFIVWYVGVTLVLLFWKNWQYFRGTCGRKGKIQQAITEQCIFFCLPNNVFLYRFEFLLMLPLVQRCINGSYTAVLFFFCCVWDLLLPKIQRRQEE